MLYGRTGSCREERSVEFRRRFLNKSPRHLGVLQLAAQKAGWDKPLPAGRYRGIAVLEAFQSYAAQVVEIFRGSQSENAEGASRGVRRGCRPCGEPANIVMQSESAVVYGLSSALYGEITIAGGRVKQSNLTIMKSCGWTPCHRRSAHRAERRKAHRCGRAVRAAAGSRAVQRYFCCNRQAHPPPADPRGGFGVARAESSQIAQASRAAEKVFLSSERSEGSAFLIGLQETARFLGQTRPSE